MARKVTPQKTPPKKVILKKPVIRRSSQAASKKPIIGLGTLVILVIFAGTFLFGLILARSKESAAAEATPTEGITYVFEKSEGIVSSIEVKPNEGEAVKLVRDDKNVWAFELPAKAEADQGLVEAAASQVSALQVIKSLAEDADPSTFGFDAPAYVIKFEFGDGKGRSLEIGDSTPTNSGYYVRVDKGGIMIADLSGIDSLTQLVDFPPYLPTPTPETTPTPSALPPPPATPEAGATPTP